MATIENSQTDEAASLDYVLHLIASKPTPHSDVHQDPDGTACILGEFATRDEAHRAGRRYLRENPTAWLQVQAPGENGEDVEA